MVITVGIGEGAFSDKSNQIIKTYALGSCVAVTGYCRARKIGGLIHCVLPEKTLHSSSNVKPWYYVDESVPLFLDRLRMYYGCMAEELEIRIFGGAKSVLGNDVFNIGHKNIMAAKKALAEANAKIIQSDTAGYFSRTVELDIETGNASVFAYPMSV